MDAKISPYGLAAKKNDEWSERRARTVGFGMAVREGVGSYEDSACIADVEGSILRTSGCRPASHLLARLEEKIVANASAIPSRDPLPEEGIGLATCSSDGQRAASTVTRAAT